MAVIRPLFDLLIDIIIIDDRIAARVIQIAFGIGKQLHIHDNPL